MHVVIIGAGRVGSSVSRWLVASGHEIAVIDRDGDRCAVLENELGSVTVTGDGTEGEVLARAGTARAGAVIATCGSDADNLVACQLARHQFNVALTTGLVRSDDHARLFNLLGIDAPINTIELVSRRIQEALPIEGVVRLMDISGSGSAVMVAVRVLPGSGAIGRRVRDLPLPVGTLIPLVIGRDGTATTPNENTALKPEDQVVAVTSIDDLDQMRDLLT
jgi:trk system potassium uptake protein TrkA